MSNIRNLAVAVVCCGLFACGEDQSAQQAAESAAGEIKEMATETAAMVEEAADDMAASMSDDSGSDMSSDSGEEAAWRKVEHEVTHFE